MTVHGYPPDAIIVFIRKRPTRPLPFHISMDVDEDEVPEHHADSRMRLVAQKVEERRHSVPHRVPVQRHMHPFAPLRCTFIILLRCTIFILLCRERTWCAPHGSAAPHFVANGYSRYFRLSEIFKMA